LTDAPALPGEVTDVGYTPAQTLTYEQWEFGFDFLRSVNRSVMWYLGDMINYGEKKWGDKYTQAMDASNYDYDTCYRAAYVASKFPQDRRRADLSWNHHRALVDLGPERQDVLLEHASDEGLSVQGLKDLRKDLEKKFNVPAEIYRLGNKTRAKIRQLFDDGVEVGETSHWNEEISAVRGTRWLKMEVAVTLVDEFDAPVGTPELSERLERIEESPQKEPVPESPPQQEA